MTKGCVLVIGGGLAGLTVAKALTMLGREVTLVERSSHLGGVVRGLHAPFPRPSDHWLGPLMEMAESGKGISVHLGCELVSWRYEGGEGLAELSDGTAVRADAVVVATGLEEVPPSLVPEYGHGSKANVLTLSELEACSSAGQRPVPGDMRHVVFIQCVGSRTERRGVPHCSGFCCTSSIKNALMLKQEDPSRDVTVLYIDVRTPGPEHEALYREARGHGVRFIRGQPSLVMERDGKLVVCGENTLLRELYELPADLVVLANGLRSDHRNAPLMSALGITLAPSGFPDMGGEESGVFLAGSIKGPMDIADTVRDAKATALDVHQHLLRGGE